MDSPFRSTFSKNFLYGGIWGIIFLLTLGTLWIVNTVRDRNLREPHVVNRFRSDFDDPVMRGDFTSNQMGRKEKFIAFGRYVFLGPGHYRCEFLPVRGTPAAGHYRLELASRKGRVILISRSVGLSEGESVPPVQLMLKEPAEIEPRMVYLEGSEMIRLDEVRIFRVASFIPWGRLIPAAAVLSALLFLLFMTILFAVQENPRWRYILSLFLLLIGMLLIVRQSWVSEDAYITLRHVDHFLGGHGPVFNPGERVEGFTHALWFFVISFFRSLGLGPRGSVLLPAYIFCLGFLYFLFFKMNFTGREKPGPVFNLAGGILIGISAFVDFGTSGLESSLSYFLLGWYAWMFTGDRWKEYPVWMGINVSLLTLNRPDFGIFFLFVLILYSYKLLKKQISPGMMMRFLLFPAVLLGGYQLFRMGYYASFFPNPYYAKSGGASHAVQGMIYLWDFCRGSLFLPVLILAVIGIGISFRRRQCDRTGRILVFSSALLYGFFVVRGGGDFMHGRFMLPTLILMTLSAAGLFDGWIGRRKVFRITGIVMVVAMVFVSQLVVPLQKRKGANAAGHHGITDERNFYMGKTRTPLKYLFADHYIIMWKTIGENYRNLSRTVRKNIRIAYPVVGFLGYYAGKHVYILDKLGLTDGVVARQKVTHRGRPGHEKKAPFGYLVYRKLTFGETPFKLWNRIADTPYGVLWDISPATLSKFSGFLDSSLKEDLDREVIAFLDQLRRSSSVNHSDFLFFLKNFWVRYAPEEGKALFEEIYDEETVAEGSECFRWIRENRPMIEERDARIRGRLMPGKFFSNVLFSLGIQ